MLNNVILYYYTYVEYSLEFIFCKCKFEISRLDMQIINNTLMLHTLSTIDFGNNILIKDIN